MTIKNFIVVDAEQYTILVVDDNINNIKVLTSYLRTFNFRILVATSGERALRQVQHILPDLILLDIIMPNMNGWETCRHLKADERTKDIPIIFITALASEDDKVNAFEEGGADYITKPIQLREVLARVMIQLNLRDLARAYQQAEQRANAEAEARRAAEAEVERLKALLEKQGYKLS